MVRERCLDVFIYLHTMGFITFTPQKNLQNILYLLSSEFCAQTHKLYTNRQMKLNRSQRVREREGEEGRNCQH